MVKHVKAFKTFQKQQNMKLIDLDVGSTVSKYTFANLLQHKSATNVQNLILWLPTTTLSKFTTGNKRYSNDKMHKFK